ncbi:thioredoxin domain-containing protein 12 precursor, putative [Pediculus humanus corporis]|uniref:Thioredoxin domain-containing protein 12, putative n=1 Tax=Pediculus humanus subsp. corporis TaxID=121224 RepID=E0VCR3_PEDHC|nr:thioredoxin domain-containing protein 12 precursor, putative [Pediculus humanus corporis]EEB11169.1 thioredoxin domain-containing protein 12 precursor, putative [Pediculus humanus corporis]
MGQIESKEKIYWVNDVEKAVLIANFTKKPVFLMIMKSFCPTCKYIEPEYVEDKDFRAKSVDQKSVEETYAVDGHYVPRIIFLDSNGKPMKQFYNASKPDAKYFYPQANEIVASMRNVLFSFYSNKNDD